MDWRDELMTEEFIRYSVECRRLARLARPLAPAKPGPAPTIQAGWFEKLAAVAGYLLSPPAPLLPGPSHPGLANRRLSRLG
jgi:hypothetical protein